jgi:hypothetical protein
MTRCTVVVAIAALSLIVGFVTGNGMAPSMPALAVGQPVAAGFAAVPGEKGGQDTFGAYKPVADWPKPLSQLPEHEKWTWGSTQGVFAESPNRVFILQRGELPNFPRPDSFPRLGRTSLSQSEACLSETPPRPALRQRVPAANWLRMGSGFTKASSASMPAGSIA